MNTFYTIGLVYYMELCYCEETFTVDSVLRYID